MCPDRRGRDRERLIHKQPPGDVFGVIFGRQGTAAARYRSNPLATDCATHTQEQRARLAPMRKATAVNNPLPAHHQTGGTYFPPAPLPPHLTASRPGWSPHPVPPLAWPTPPVAPRQRSSGGVVAVVIVGVVLLIAAVVAGAIMIGVGVSRVQAPAHPVVTFTPAPPPSLPSLPALSGLSGTWTVGSCAAPDPNDQPDGYRAVDCVDPGAVATVTDRLPISSFDVDAPRCPSGTDIVLDLTRVREGVDTGIPTGTACLRNLTGPHPGDPGQGGGQLVEGDCITLPGKSYQHISEVPCATGGAKVLVLLPTGSHCPAGTTDPVEMLTPNSRFGVICTRR